MPSAVQQRVDQAVVDLKSGGRLEEKVSTASAVTATEMNRRIAEELGFVARKLELLGDALSGDPLVVGRHAHELQELDIAMQVLGHLATVLQSADPIQSAERIGMAELSRRLTRKQL